MSDVRGDMVKLVIPTGQEVDASPCEEPGLCVAVFADGICLMQYETGTTVLQDFASVADAHKAAAVIGEWFDWSLSPDEIFSVIPRPALRARLAAAFPRHVVPDSIPLSELVTRNHAEGTVL